MKKVLLDTNAYSSYLAGDQNVLEALECAEIVFMSIFVLGELYAGFKGGSKESANLEILKKFLLKPTVTTLVATNETAEIFGMLKSTMKNAGTPLPINDVWIASHAIEAGAGLVTYDTHFSKIGGLHLWSGIS